MIPVEPTAHDGADIINVLDGSAEDYGVTMPASIDQEGLVMVEYELTADDLQMLMAGGRVRFWIFTLGNPLSPFKVEVVAPETSAKES